MNVTDTEKDAIRVEVASLYQRLVEVETSAHGRSEGERRARYAARRLTLNVSYDYIIAELGRLLERCPQYRFTAETADAMQRLGSSQYGARQLRDLLRIACAVEAPAYALARTATILASDDATSATIAE